MRIFENPIVLVTLIVLIIVLFGAKRMPDVAKSVGSSLKIFKKEVQELTGDDDASKGTQGSTAQNTAAQNTVQDATTASTSTPSTSAATTQPAARTDESSTQASGSGDSQNS